MPTNPLPRSQNPILFQRTSFLIYLTVASVAFLFLVRHFLLIIFMAGIFTALTYPIFFWLLMKTNKRILSAVLTLLLLLLILVLPLIAVGTLAYQEAVGFIMNLDFDALKGRVESFLLGMRDRYPFLLKAVNPQDLSRQAFGYVQGVLQYVLRNSASFSFLLMNKLLNLGLMLFAMFYFYIDGHRILQKLIRWSPLKDEYDMILLQKFTSVTKGTLKGILVIGAIQGTIGAVLFWATGVASPVLLGVLMVFGSIIPAVGGAIVWVPTAIIMALQGHTAQALIILAVGGIVISSVDNVLRPILVGKDIKMHDLLVLFSTLGGISIFGLVGFILGPIIASMFVSIWHMYEDVFQNELELNERQNAGLLAAAMGQEPPQPAPVRPPAEPPCETAPGA